MRTFGLLGKTLKHSFSQTYFTSKFQRQVIAKDVAQDATQDSAKDVSQDASQGERYINIELGSIENIRVTSEMQVLAGFNVTIPYK
jgi:shikimate 5-dehydrogenase